MAVQIVTMGIVFGMIFKTDISSYLPFLATSVVVWGFISTSIIEGCLTFTSSEAIIRQLTIPHYQFVVRVLWKNILVAGHNFAILPIVLAVFLRLPNWSLIAIFPGLILLIANLTWIVWFLGMATARFRDMPPMISSLLTIAFYVTPVMWYPNLIENNSLSHLLLGLNPLYHFLQIIRLPILGEWPTWENWLVTCASAFLGWCLVFLMNRAHKHKIAFWV